MKKKFLITLIAVCTMLLAFGIINASAATDGIYTYSVSKEKATITGCTSAQGQLVIPVSLGGYPVTTIGDFAFSYCSYGPESITIPDGVTSIGKYAFECCDRLRNITIPNSVTSIGEGAFSGCIELKDVYFYGTEEEWNKISIGSDNESLTNATIHFVFTKTTLSNNDKTFTIKTNNIEKGNVIVLALYDDKQFIEMQYKVYTGDVVPFTTTKDYTKAKVFVWDDLTTQEPVCEAEIVK